MRFIKNVCLAALLSVVGFGTHAAELPSEDAAGSKRLPNVVFILADDLGWSDTTLYDTTDFYKTPHIQRLAERGMTFTRAYSASPLCSPTRASILTGQSPARHGITAPNCHTPTIRMSVAMRDSAAPNQFAIQPDPVTRLAPSYVTLAETLKQAGYATGHFGKWHLGAEPYSALEHGFDVDVPHWHGPGPAGSYVAPWKFPDFDHDPQIPDEHIEDRMAKEAVAFMDAHQDEPFFLNYWMFSVHAPFDAKRALIEQYDQVVDPSDAQRCPTYAAMIESMDDAVGTLTDRLDQLGIADNTIIVFASDNGGNMYNLVEGQRPTSNRPLRGGKATMYEGGIRTPAIIAWPGHVDPASTSEAIIQSMDYYPTLLEMLGIDAPEQTTFDGISLVPALRGEDLDREGIFTYFPHNPPVPDWIPPAISVHQQDWKLIRIFHGGVDGAHRYRLYNLRDDIGERTDLSASHPDRVSRLDALIDAHLVEANATPPRRNPKFDSQSYDVSKEGVSAAKFQPGGASPPPKKKPAKPVAGWQPGGTCELAAVGRTLRFQSTGTDPYASFALPRPAAPGPLTLKLRMKSDSSGSGQIFWRGEGQVFASDRSQFFDVTHDGNSNDYSIELMPESPVLSVRIDPSRGQGTIDVTEAALLDADQNVIHQWSF
ncbi:MAG: sulfatase [Planctomycetota bacterium]